jgi:hypothetical protein
MRSMKIANAGSIQVPRALAADAGFGAVAFCGRGAKITTIKTT